MNIIPNYKHALKVAWCTALASLMLAVSAQAAPEEAEGHEDGHDEGRVELSQAQIQHAGIGLAQVQSGSLQVSLSVYGTVSTNHEQVQRVSARFDGVIRSIDKRIGDTVKRGDTLLRVEANESMQAYTIVATVNGVVTQRDANVGEQTNARTLLVIEDLSTVWVELALFPRDLRQVHVGQTVIVSNKSRDHSADGVVTYIAPVGNAANQTVTARVPLPNPERRWLPGQFVVGDIIVSAITAPLVVAAESLQMIEGRPVIFVQSDEGFVPRQVQLGGSDGRFTEVLSGLNSGETYVTRNSFVLKSELGKGDAEHGH